VHPNSVLEQTVMQGFTMKNKLPVSICTLGIVFGLTSPAFAGLIAGDYSNSADLSGYRSFSEYSNFPYVGGLLLNGSRGSTCSGSLISSQWVLTSGHCVYASKKDESIKGFYSGKFFLDDGRISRSIVGAITHKTWGSLVANNYDRGLSVQNTINDIALLKLDRAITDVNLPLMPHFLFDVPSTFTGSFTGYGDEGDGSKGFIGEKANPRKGALGGQNIVTELGNGVLFYDLDRPNTTSSGGPTNIDGQPSVALEFMPGGGDSGSPVIYNDYIVGVHSRRGDSLKCNSIGLFCTTLKWDKFGARGVATPVTAYSGWIANTIKDFQDKPVIPTFPSGVKVKFIAGGYTGVPYVGSLPLALDASEIEVDDSLFEVGFELTEDTFSDEFNQTVFDTIFNNQNPDPTPTPVPTPALLPGLVGLGLNLWRKRRNEAQEKQV
jgi:secreted trypsin-like serine protease